MKIEVISLFPKMFESPFGESIIGRAISKGIIELKVHNLRNWAWNDYGAVDDRPFGGGVGMLIRVDVVDKALKGVVGDDYQKNKTEKRKIVLTSARGKRFDQKMAEEWSKLDNLVLICGHYEGVDQRVADELADEEVSIGDYVLSGGELPAMVMIDATARLVGGVLGKDESSKQESFSAQEIDGQELRAIEYPQYTRPQEYRGWKVPEVLLSGDPKKIKKWQEEETKKLCR